MNIVHWLKQKFGAGGRTRTAFFAVAMLTPFCAANVYAQTSLPPPPAPEPISVTELPIPPTAPSKTVGSCTAAINPHGTGCIDASSLALQGGSFLPGDHEVLASISYTGAPASGPSSIYSGAQDILVKTDGTTFSNGDPWKCLTCGVPAANAVDINPLVVGDYPQSFNDGMRVLDSLDILDCTPYKLDSAQCTPSALHIYPLRFNVTADGSGPGGSIRELRIHPDNVHIGFNILSITATAANEYPLFGRLVFNPSPTTGVPLAPRYDIVNADLLTPSTPTEGVVQQAPGHPSQLVINHNAITVGEFRGFSKDGTEAFYIGQPWESDNIDVFAVSMTTGAVRRMTNNPGYVDPLDASPDNQWIVMDETMPSTRMQFMSAMRDVPPLNDFITIGSVSSVRNNGNRRFFQPILLDRYAERGSYQGQQINAGSTSPGGIGDPNWNAMADPRWSWGGTEVTYWQALVVSPECGGTNPLPCPVSTEPGGRATRLMLAKLTSRTPYNYTPPAPVADRVPWATPYVPGEVWPAAVLLPTGVYKLAGQTSGSATVQIIQNATQTGYDKVQVTYTNYSDDGVLKLNGQETVVNLAPNFYTQHLLWSSNLTQTGYNAGNIVGNGTKGMFVVNKKTTSPGGMNLTISLINNLFNATGTLSSLVDGVLYTQPGNND
jgi:hypothetical protein